MLRLSLLTLLVAASISMGSAQQRPTASTATDERVLAPGAYREAYSLHEYASPDEAREAILLEHEAEAEARRLAYAPIRAARRTQLLADLARLPRPERRHRTPRTAQQRGSLTVFTVDSAYDEGDTAIDGSCGNLFGECTLRAAIQEANAVPVTDGVLIEFEITLGPIPASPSGVWTIPVNIDAGFGAFGPLPGITRSVVVDGTTQSGAACGSLTTGIPHALRVFLDGTLVVDGPNAQNGLVAFSESNAFYGLAIGNFPGAGISLGSFASTFQTFLSCNNLGTDAAGTTAQPNWDGVTADQPFELSYSLVSGNLGSGVNLVDVRNVGGSLLRGNLIGTDATGTLALGNGAYGVFGLFVDNVQVGTNFLPFEFNVISGNALDGVYLHCEGCVTEYNRVGTNREATAAIGNGRNGIWVASFLDPLTVRDNIVSGNGEIGIQFSGDGFFAPVGGVVEDNRVGTDFSGNVPLGNGLSGIVLQSAQGAVVRGNQSSANADAGIYIEDSRPAGYWTTVIENNILGTDPDGVLDLGNGLAGILCQRANDVRVGGTAGGQANRIAFNGGDGLFLRTDCRKVAVLSNAIYSNDGLGIDLFANGVTANDAGDGDAGANDLTNFPIALSVTNDGTNARISLKLNALPNQQYRVELFTSPGADPSAFGEGRTFATFATPTTGANGKKTVNLTRPAALFPVGQWVAATATPVDGTSFTGYRGTSEFGRAAQVQATGVTGEAAASSAGEGLPAVLALHAAYPNPFGGATTLRFDLPEAAPVRLVVYDVLGREVARLVDGDQEAGQHAVLLDGRRLPAGTYVVRLEAEGQVRTRRVTVVR